ncbi:MAG: hypothetical protein IT251_04740 [Chitinophagaceae bacterium]|nr:hypothetical protein [Chitinophagaceae bacterium]
MPAITKKTRTPKMKLNDMAAALGLTAEKQRHNLKELGKAIREIHKGKDFYEMRKTFWR